MLKTLWNDGGPRWLRETDWRTPWPYIGGIIVTGLIVALVRHIGGQGATTPTVESSDDRLADYTFWLMVFTAALSMVSVLQLWILARADNTARITAEAARDTAEATIAAQRPWLKFELELNGPLNGGMDGVYLPVRFKYRNVGNNPAIDVHPSVTLVCGERGVNISEAFRKIPPLTDYPGAIVFPNDDSLGAITEGVLPAHEIKTALAAVPNNDQIRIGGVACLRYRYAGGREGQTAKAFVLHAKNEPAHFDPRKLPIPKENLILDAYGLFETAT